MPVRFQVDADFYDHPKTIGMSDSATALWTRAGSYSTAKLLDGFVPESVIRSLSAVPDEAASELVRRGLWRKVRGGYRFHQWKERGNLTREQIEQERNADRQRKRRQRQLDKQTEEAQVKPERNDVKRKRNTQREQQPKQGENGRESVKPQADSGFVRPDSDPESDVTPGGIRGLSVSVSESVSKPPNPQRGENGSRRSSSYDYDSDDDFLRFWDVYPVKKAKPQAYKAWKAARKRGVTPDTVIDAAARYRDNPDRKPDYTAHPSTWLNGERYNDFDDVTSAPTSNEAWWDN